MFKRLGLSACLIFSVQTLAADNIPAPATCPVKTKSKISAVEKKSLGFAKKVEGFHAKHKAVAPVGGRMPASFCKDGTGKAAQLAREGFPLTDELESIESSHAASECATLARSARMKIDKLFMDLNSAYIQPCMAP